MQSLVTLKPEYLEKVFHEDTSQSEILITLYRIVFPEFDQIEKCEGWPVCNKTTWKRICNMFQEFDNRVTNPRLRQAGKLEVMPGVLWLNNGFSCNHALAETLQDWEVLPCEVERKGGSY